MLKGNNYMRRYNGFYYQDKRLKRNLQLWLMKQFIFSVEKMAKYAYENTSFYKEHLYETLNEYGSFDKIPYERIPLVKKSAIIKRSPFDLLSRDIEKDVCIYGETAGSSGSPSPSFFTKKEFSDSITLSKISPFNAILAELVKTNRRVVYGLTNGFSIAGSTFQQILEELGFLSINIDTRSAIAPPERVARLLSKFKPSIIVASEADFLSWMKTVKEYYPDSYNEVLYNLKALISTAELCSTNRSRQISRYFDIYHIDVYGCMEGFFAVPCLCGEKHILPVYKTEVLSDDLSNSREYGTGRLVYTNLYRKSTPFVRYLVDDYVTIYKSECPYGFDKSIIPHGRYELTVDLNGRKYGIGQFENIIFRNYLFGEYQIQILSDRILVTVEDYQYCRIPTEQIIRDLRNELGTLIDLEVKHYGKIRDYKSVWDAKPVLRLIDARVFSTQQVPEYA